MLKMVSRTLWILADWVGIALKRLRLHRQAIFVFRRALAAYPDDHFARLHLAWLLLEQGGMDEADQHLRELLARWRERPDLYAGLGYALQARSRHWEAVEAFANALALRPDDVDARYRLADTYLIVSEHEKAIVELRTILAREPGHLNSLWALGVTFGRLGRWEESEEYCRRAVELEPSSLHLYNLGIALAEVGKLDEAEQALRRALDLKSDDRSVRVRLAVVLSQRERLDEAIALFTQPTISVSENAEGFADFVDFLLQTQRTVDALRAAQEAAGRYPNVAATHTELGWALAQTNRFSEALGSFEHALALDATHADALAGRAIAHSVLGDHRRAVDDFSRLAEIDPDYARDPEVTGHLERSKAALNSPA
jgi:tetratricopeptide (TPR) repeat protein